MIAEIIERRPNYDREILECYVATHGTASLTEILATIQRADEMDVVFEVK